jgi:hypothetical protein
MNRLIVLASLAAAFGCSQAPVEGRDAHEADLSAFVGAWKSVTPSFEFVRLNVSETAEPDVLAARLTLSGLALDATGRRDADSLVTPMTTAGGGQAAGTLAVRTVNDRTLSVEIRPTGGAVQSLSFVRE